MGLGSVAPHCQWQPILRLSSRAVPVPWYLTATALASLLPLGSQRRDGDNILGLVYSLMTTIVY